MHHLLVLLHLASARWGKILATWEQRRGKGQARWGNVHLRAWRLASVASVASRSRGVAFRSIAAAQQCAVSGPRDSAAVARIPGARLRDDQDASRRQIGTHSSARLHSPTIKDTRSHNRFTNRALGGERKNKVRKTPYFGRASVAGSHRRLPRVRARISGKLFRDNWIILAGAFPRCRGPTEEEAGDGFTTRWRENSRSPCTNVALFACEYLVKSRALYLN